MVHFIGLPVKSSGENGKTRENRGIKILHNNGKKRIIRGKNLRKEGYYGR